MAKKTYAEIQAEIERLQSEAEEVKNEELQGVIDRMKEAIRIYGLTPRDLGFEGGRGGRGRGAAAKPAAAPRRGPGRKAAGASSKPKFQDGQGNTWGGRGPRPQWLREALASGRSLEDFAVRR